MEFMFTSVYSPLQREYSTISRINLEECLGDHPGKLSLGYSMEIKFYSVKNIY